MGVYDCLTRGSQVKCWDCEMETKEVGDKVADGDYVVLLQEGGYVRVKGGIIVRIVENYGRKLYYPEDFPNERCIDKWGSEVKTAKDLEHACIFGEAHYYWYHLKRRKEWLKRRNAL